MPGNDDRDPVGINIDSLNKIMNDIDKLKELNSFKHSFSEFQADVVQVLGYRRRSDDEFILIPSTIDATKSAYASLFVDIVKQIDELVYKLKEQGLEVPKLDD